MWDVPGTAPPPRRSRDRAPDVVADAAAGPGCVLAGSPASPAILFLHGFMGSSGDWSGLTATLEDRFFCVAVDLPGHGASLGLPRSRYTMAGAAGSVVGALDGLGVGRATVVGYSMGGRLALYLALRYPDRCSGLFLESASPGLGDARGRAARRADDEEKARRLERGDFAEFLHDWYRQPLFAPLARDEGLLRRTAESRQRNDPHELAKSLRGMGTGSQPSLWGALPGLEAPALAVVGELDGKFVGISRRMQGLSPRMRGAVVPGVGHNVRLEAPDAYSRLLKGFIEDPYNPAHD